MPAERCPVIERATRKAAIEADDPKLIVTCEQLRPDVEWSVLRDPGNTAPSELLPEAAQ